MQPTYREVGTVAMPTEFHPLMDLDGLWTTALADQFLPLPDMPAAKYECIDGRLIVSPTEGFANSHGEAKLIRLIIDEAEAAGLHVCGTVNLTFSPGTWIQPDVTILHALPKTEKEDTWIPVGLCTMAVEFVSKGNRKQDFVNKPKRCAEAGVPYFMRVELVPRLGHASVKLLKLVNGGYVTLTEAISGERFDAAEPFPMSFDPRELL